MDLVDWSEARFDEICTEFREFASRLEIPDIRFIPISALEGDGVVERSRRMDWYQGSPLLHTLETVYIGSDNNHIDARFPVQMVIRPKNGGADEFRGFAGRIAAGVFKPGDDVVILPAGRQTRIESISSLGQPVTEAFAPMSVEMSLTDEIDLGRGDMLAKLHNQPRSTCDIEAMVCWFSEQPLDPNRRLVVRHTTREARCVIKEVRYKIDINTLHRKEGDLAIGLNDIGRMHIRTSIPLLVDAYSRNRNTGSLVLIDEATSATVGAGMIL
jgi:sulfate adenylyltransferase subunit 1